MCEESSLREAAQRTAARITDMISATPADRRCAAEERRIMVTCISLALSGHYTAGTSEGRRQARADARSMFLFGLVVGMIFVSTIGHFLWAS